MTTKLFTNTPTVSASNRVINPPKVYEGGSLESVDEAVIHNDTTELDVAFTIASIVAICITCSVACTLKTNDPDTPDESIILKPDVPYIWTTDSYDAFLLETDVTALFVTVPGSVTGLLRMEILRDITP